MPLALADTAYIALGAIIIAIIIALIKSSSDTEDERLEKYIKESMAQLLMTRFNLLTTAKTKKVIWEDKNGVYRHLGASSSYGDIGPGEFMIFFKKDPKKFLIFPNVFAVANCIRTIAESVKIVGDKIIIKCYGFEPIDDYWYTITDKMSLGDIESMIKRDRDKLMVPSMRRELVKTAEAKVDGSIMSRISMEDIGDLENRYTKAKKEAPAVELS